MKRPAVVGTITPRLPVKLAERCNCLLFHDGRLARPCYAHYTRMLRTIFKREDV